MNDQSTIRMVLSYVFTIAFAAIGGAIWLAVRTDVVDPMVVIAGLLGLAATALGFIGGMLSQTNSTPNATVAVVDDEAGISLVEVLIVVVVIVLFVLLFRGRI